MRHWQEDALNLKFIKFLEANVILGTKPNGTDKYFKFCYQPFPLENNLFFFSTFLGDEILDDALSQEIIDIVNKN